ncbi:hypothetical protein SAMN02745216_00754 [Desulfatibacillum alkenivorans DSM 16219]|jgi:hypothetical protein|uniref:Uncharacterized protein n=1 Tax=Desulfatibacillum alkenivorans DSM 16219 TaxID=1121393 RepID=A0A1M6F963_9BACT|nr:hypothetical protein [Desulfatibacillum alkenivorans]SHI94213.1 hypothetical protein SAMN02745216_00754 [Desulfatibacillum alkenivorans DSM 16219]
MHARTLVFSAVIFLAAFTAGFAADAPITPENLLFSPDDVITMERAEHFLNMAVDLGMEEMGDNSLESMVCTPHALPKKLFFQALCDCATDPETKVSDLEILALSEEADRSGEGEEDVKLSLKDVNQDATSYGFFLRNPAADAGAVVIPAPSREVLSTGAIPEGWTNRILRTGSASF